METLRNKGEAMKDQTELIVVLFLLCLFFMMAFLVLVSRAEAECRCFYVQGRATQVCQRNTDPPAFCSPGYQDLADQTRHNREHWKRLMRIKPGSANFNQQVLDAMEGNDEADEE